MNNFITEVDALDEAKECFLTYAAEVLTDRAIPAAEDGLLSSQRKILWTMEDHLKMDSKGKTKKCNAIVGSTLSTSYYHGDSSCYGVLCKMSQSYLMRYPLIHPQGSLGTQEDNDLVASSRYCVTGDTLIATEKGTIPIKDIVPNSKEDSEYDINLIVQGGFGEKRLATKFFNTGMRDIYKIQLKNGQWIKVTPNHPLLTLDKELNIVWKLAENLTTEDKLLISYNIENACFGKNDNLTEAKMLGCMISEGYATTQNRLGINNKDLDMVQPVFDFIHSTITNTASINYNDKRKYYEYCVADQEYYKNFVETYEFEKSDKKHLPLCFMSGTKEYQAVCLSYLFEGDGTVDSDYGISYSSISEELIHQLQVILLQNFGIISSIFRTKNRKEIKLHINNVSAERFMQQINFVSEWKKENLKQLVERFNRQPNIANGNICAIHEITQYIRKHHLPGCASTVNSISFNNLKTINKAKQYLKETDYIKLKSIIDNYYYLPITSIEKTEREIAYSIKINDKTHSFIGNGFINHNTEAKPSIYTDLMMLDYKKNPVPTKETYNGEYMEPVILPALFPNALCNGRQAIGISMAHSSVPHNLGEVCNAVLAYVDNHNLTIDDIMQYIKGPDFPLGGQVINSKDIRAAFSTGKSSVSLKVRGDYEIDGDKIIFTTIPYRTYRNKIKEQLEKNVDEFEKCLDDFNDESNIGNNRLVFFAKTGQVKTLLNKLFALTDLQTTISYNMNFIVDGTPKLCSIKDLIKAYVIHQNNVMINIAKTDLAKAQAREHILEGLLIAIKDIDTAIQLIKSSNDKKEACKKLIEHFGITETQANAVLDMKLAKLTKLDKDELLKELEEIRQAIIKYTKIIEDQEFRNEELKKKIIWLRDTYGDARRTQLLNLAETSKEDKEIEFVEPEKCVVVLTESGCVKRIPATSFRNQRRNGKGVKTQDDITSMVLRTNTIDSLMIFTNQGRMYRLLVNDIPVGTNVSKGQAVSSLIEMEPGEKPVLIYSIYRDTNAKYVFFATKNGTVKKTALSEYIDTKKKGGIIAIKLREGDSLAAVSLINDEPIILVSKNGMAIKFKSTDVSVTSRATIGIKGINIKDDDEIVAGVPVRDETDELAVFSTMGLGKKITLEELPLQMRGGKGLMVYKSTIEVVSAVLVSEEDSILLCGDKSSICISASEISNMGRAAIGNQLIKANQLISVSKV